MARIVLRQERSRRKGGETVNTSSAVPSQGHVRPPWPYDARTNIRVARRRPGVTIQRMDHVGIVVDELAKFHALSARGGDQ
jgi:hypothetical protein